jgi:hypothetical protein
MKGAFVVVWIPWRCLTAEATERLSFRLLKAVDVWGDRHRASLPVVASSAPPARRGSGAEEVGLHLGGYRRVSQPQYSRLMRPISARYPAGLSLRVSARIWVSRLAS